MTDHDPVNMTELANAMRVSRSTVYGWIKLGYLPEFGRRTTIAHCKKWLRDWYSPHLQSLKRERALQQERLLSRLR